MQCCSKCRQQNIQLCCKSYAHEKIIYNPCHNQLWYVNANKAVPINKPLLLDSNLNLIEHDTHLEVRHNNLITGEAHTKYNKQILLSIPIEHNTVVSVSAHVLGVEFTTGATGCYYIKATFKRKDGQITKVNLTDRTELLEMQHTQVQFELTDSIQIMVQSQAQVKWTGSVQLQKISF